MFGLVPRRRERMALARRREFEPFEFFRREFAPLFEVPSWMMRPVWERLAEPWGFETEETENEVVLRAEAPGFEPSEVEVTLRGNVLTVRAEHTEPAPAEGEAREGRYARLERTITLPPGVAAERVEARYHAGVIEIHLPRTPEAKPRRIEVKT